MSNIISFKIPFKKNENGETILNGVNKISINEWTKKFKAECSNKEILDIIVSVMKDSNVDEPHFDIGFKVQ